MNRSPTGILDEAALNTSNQFVFNTSRSVRSYADASPLLVTTSVMVMVSPASTLAGVMSLVIPRRGSITVFVTVPDQTTLLGLPAKVASAWLVNAVCWPLVQPRLPATLRTSALNRIAKVLLLVPSVPVQTVAPCSLKAMTCALPASAPAAPLGVSNNVPGLPEKPVVSRVAEP